MQAEHPAAGGRSGGSVQAVSETAGVLSAVVLPGLTKGAGDRPRRLLVAPGVKEVRLQLDVPGFRGDLAARVDLLLVEENHHRLVWSRDGIPSAPTLTGRTVLISMKPEDLVPAITLFTSEGRLPRRKARRLSRTRLGSFGHSSALLS